MFIPSGEQFGSHGWLMSGNVSGNAMNVIRGNLLSVCVGKDGREIKEVKNGFRLPIFKRRFLVVLLYETFPCKISTMFCLFSLQFLSVLTDPSLHQPNPFHRNVPCECMLITLPVDPIPPSGSFASHALWSAYLFTWFNWGSILKLPPPPRPSD